MRVQPLNGQVLLRRVEAEEKTAGGIFLPDSAREEPAEGLVEAMPPGGDAELAIGDRVLFKKFTGQEISVDGAKLLLVPMGDLLAKYVKADPVPA